MIKFFILTKKSQLIIEYKKMSLRRGQFKEQKDEEDRKTLRLELNRSNIKPRRQIAEKYLLCLCGFFFGKGR